MVRGLVGIQRTVCHQRFIRARSQLAPLCTGIAVHGAGRAAEMRNYICTPQCSCHSLSGIPLALISGLHTARIFFSHCSALRRKWNIRHACRPCRDISTWYCGNGACNVEHFDSKIVCIPCHQGRIQQEVLSHCSALWHKCNTQHACRPCPEISTWYCRIGACNAEHFDLRIICIPCYQCYIQQEFFSHCSPLDTDWICSMLVRRFLHNTSELERSTSNILI